MKWNAWGDPAEAKPLSDGIRSLLKQAVGLEESTTAELEPDQVRLRPSALSPADHEGLAAIVGADYCGIDDRARLLRAGGKSTLDLLRRKDSGVQDAPDAVLLPGSDEEIAAILRFCEDHSIAIVPFGGGTSVVGGLDPIRGDFKAVVSLDLRRLDQLHALDEVSEEAELGAGLTGRTPNGCWVSAAIPWATSRRVSSSRPSADTQRRGRPARTPRVTAASTTWCGACGQ